MILRLFKLSLYAGGLAVGGLVAWAATRPAVEGSGRAATEDRAVAGDPTDVRVTGAAEVVLVQGSVPSVQVTADDNILPHLSAEVDGRRLTLGAKSSATLRPKSAIRWTVTVRHLTAVTVSGAASVTAERFACNDLSVKLSGVGRAEFRDLDCKGLTLTQSGAGAATVTGAAHQFTAKLSGAGTLDAAKFKAQIGDVQVSGAGGARVWAQGTLKARASGSGTVAYRGSPYFEQRKTSGSGSIRQLADAEFAIAASKSTD